METFVLRILQDQVAFQCKAASIAALHVNESLVTRDIEGTFIALQSLLVAAANLSKLFWGSRGRKESERTPLRDSLGVANDSSLRDPDLRNDFEHFDERVERWFKTSEHRNYLGRMIGPTNTVVGMATGDRFQQFDPQSGVVTFWDNSVQLNAVLAEINRILPLAEIEARKPHWDPPEASVAPA
jgi:hypothetical protein